MSIVTGTLWSIGQNINGTLGLGNLTNLSSPVQVGSLTTWKQVSTGISNLYAVKTDGTLWSCGYNYRGQLGDSSAVNSRSSMVQVGSLTDWANAKVDAGEYAVGAVKSNGTLWVWGYNLYGQLGLGDGYASPSRSSPTQVGTLSNWKQISVGARMMAAVKTDGTLWSWGYDGGSSGMLGLADPYVTWASSPVQVGSLSDWKQVSCGQPASSATTAAVKTDGTLWTWGINGSGRLGQSLPVATRLSSPVQVGSLTDWSAVSADISAMFAIKTDGTLWAWGDNTTGQLGLGDTIHRSSPVQVGSLTNWYSVDSANGTVGAVKTDGTFWVWGDNGVGQLNTGDLTPRSSPVQYGSAINWLTSSYAVSNGRIQYALVTITQMPALPTYHAGSLWVAGNNQSGMLGLSNTTILAMSSPAQVGSLTNWKSISYGVDFAAAIKIDGTLWMWGYNLQGQLGLGDRVDRSSPVQVGSLTNWSQVSCEYHTGAIKTDGTLWTWGRNYNGQLGLGDIIHRSSPVQVGSLTDWYQVSCGYSSAAIKTDGTLWVWGSNWTFPHGYLGLGDTIDRSSPTQMGSLNNWYSVITSSTGMSAAIKTDGTLWSWGQNWGGQLGLGDTVERSSPVQVGSLTNWKSISCGYNNAFAAIKTDGTLWSWGQNWGGQLGLGDTVERSSPVQVGSLTTWAQVSCGFHTMHIRKTDGTLWACGYNDSGQLAIGDIIHRSSPTQVGSLTTWKSLSEKYFLTIGVIQYTPPPILPGQLWSWGENYSGKLGLGDIVKRSSPTQVGSLSDWTQIAVGEDVVSAIKTDGTLWTWGDNYSGQLGLGDIIHRSSPVQVGSLTDWYQISSGYIATHAIKTDGTLWTWGDNYSGQLGIGTSGVAANISSPIQVGSLSDWSQISSGYEAIHAIKTNGTLWTWGSNVNGRLGLGDNINRSSPVQVGSLSDWRQVASAETHRAAIKTDGTLWTWGDNVYGQLGLGDTIDRSSPVQVGSLNDWTQVSCGYQTVAIKTDGTRWTWGANWYGQLGLGDIIHRSSPVQVGSLTDWAVLADSYATSYQIKTDGTLWACGYNWHGNLGEGYPIGNGVSSPVQVGTLTDWLHISATRYAAMGIRSGVYVPPLPTTRGFIVAVRDDGSMWASGNNVYGQLGNFDTVNMSSPVQVGLTSNWRIASAGRGYAVGIQHDNSMWSWGRNDSATLGAFDLIDRSSPVQIGNTIKWDLVSSGANTAAAITTDNMLYMWGSDINGVLAHNDVNITRQAPAIVDTYHKWKAISVGVDHALSINEETMIIDLGTATVLPTAPKVSTNILHSTGVGSLYDGTWNFAAQTGMIYGNVYGLQVETDLLTPSQIGIPSYWKKLAVNSSISLYGIDTDNFLWAWGDNSFGQLGLSTAGTVETRPVLVGVEQWATISTGASHVLAIKTNGSLWAWGYNTTGQLGLGDTIHRSSPVQVGSLTDWAQIASGIDVVVAIKTDGTLWTWGYNWSGQLGLGDTIDRSSPVQIGSLNDWTQISAGDQFASAIKTDGTLWSWGTNVYGQLGLGDTITRSSPVQVGSLTDWKQVSSETHSSTSIKTDGTLWAWGININGQLGLGDTVDRSSPVQVGSLTNWTQVDTNQYATVALHNSAAYSIRTTRWYGTGDNEYTMLGFNDIQSSSHSTLAEPTSPSIDYTVDIATGRYNTAQIRASGALFIAGRGTAGILGNGTEITVGSPAQVGSLTNWKQISLGNFTSAATKTDGTLWAWGNNQFGQLGLGDIIPRSSPVQVGSLTNWAQVVTSIGDFAFTIAIKTDGTLWSWGYNNYGQLGLGDTITRSSPVQVGSLNDWKQVSACTENVLAIKTDNTLWAWGDNYTGQLGLGNTLRKSSPVQVGSLTDWKQVSVGRQSAGAIKTDGTLWMWGAMGNGALGNGESAVGNLLSPIQIGSLTEWNLLSNGYDHSFAIKTDGTLWSWGSAVPLETNARVLGFDDTTNRLVPTRVGPFDDWVNVSTHVGTLAIREYKVQSATQYAVDQIRNDFALWEWGSNNV